MDFLDKTLPADPPPGAVASGPAAPRRPALTGEALAQAIAPTSPSLMTPPLVPDDADQALVGTMIGSFKLVRMLGRGGMGTVYLGQQESIGSQIAVKFLHPHLSADPRLVARFYAEARAVNLIAHENVVSIFDLGVVPPNLHYLMMEYLDGQPLSALAMPAPLEVVIPILAQICDALGAAHRLGIVHRDLKPENILLVRRGGTEHFVKLLDFGVARMATSASGGTQTSVGIIVGTPLYMAPEQYLSARVDGRSDLYSLGVVAFLLTTGQLPFSGSPSEVLIAHRERPVPSPRDLNPSLPPALSDAILCALAKRPQDRFQTAAAFREALLAAVEHGRSASVAIPPPTAPKTPAAEAVLSEPNGRELGRMRCIQLSRGGLFACTDGALPPLFSRLNLSLLLGGGALNCPVEVVRHVRHSEAVAWGMPAGFGVQFVEMTPAFKESLARILRGQPLARAAVAAPTNDDPTAEPILVEFLSRSRLDPYGFLSLPRDAPMGEVRSRGRDDQRRLEMLRDRPLSAGQRGRLSACLERVAWALAALGQPARRAEYDARSGNYQGVARCIAAGLSPTELGEIRRRYLAENRGADAKAMMYILTGRSFEAQGDEERAIEQYERALGLDPLNLELQRTYWGLKRRQEELKRPAGARAPERGGFPDGRGIGSQR